MGRRRQARENALHALYLHEAGLEAGAAIAAAQIRTDDVSAREFSRRLFEGTLERRGELDEIITRIAVNWQIKRMAAVDRSILRMAAFELLNCPETPPNVVINEAIEIARKFSMEDSASFVNGILDKIRLLRTVDGG